MLIQSTILQTFSEERLDPLAGRPSARIMERNEWRPSTAFQKGRGSILSVTSAGIEGHSSEPQSSDYRGSLAWLIWSPLAFARRRPFEHEFFGVDRPSANVRDRWPGGA